jgi:hypothetical protein
VYLSGVSVRKEIVKKTLADSAWEAAFGSSR